MIIPVFACVIDARDVLPPMERDNQLDRSVLPFTTLHPPFYPGVPISCLTSPIFIIFKGTWTTFGKLESARVIWIPWTRALSIGSRSVKAWSKQPGTHFVQFHKVKTDLILNSLIYKRAFVSLAVLPKTAIQRRLGPTNCKPLQSYPYNEYIQQISKKK